MTLYAYLSYSICLLDIRKDFVFFYRSREVWTHVSLKTQVLTAARWVTMLRAIYAISCYNELLTMKENCSLNISLNIIIRKYSSCTKTYIIWRLRCILSIMRKKLLSVAGVHSSFLLLSTSSTLFRQNYCGGFNDKLFFSATSSKTFLCKCVIEN